MLVSNKQVDFFALSNNPPIKTHDHVFMYGDFILRHPELKSGLEFLLSNIY